MLAASKAPGKPVGRYCSLARCIGMAAIGATLGGSPGHARSDVPAGPFGIAMGTDVGSMPGCEALAEHPGRYMCKTVPRPHVDFTRYVVEAPDGVGACWIQAVSEPILDSGYGFNLRNHADKLAEEISVRYGKAKKLEMTLPSSIWSEPRYRLMAIRKGDAMYSYAWPDLKRRPIAGITQISIRIESYGMENGYIFARFVFSNVDACDQIEKKRRASAF